MSSVISHYPLGDQAIVLSFGDYISAEINAMIRETVAFLETSGELGIIEFVPAYTTVTIYYDPLTIRYEELSAYLQDMVCGADSPKIRRSSNKEIPVYYDGPDLNDVAQYHGLSEEEVIRIHSEAEYIVYMIGFAPGFPYLGGMDSRIATPRKQVPRLKIEAGAVGIAGEQTGVYPIETPGGWQIIGQTPLQLFDIKRDKPALLEVGDRVRFVPIDKTAFEKLRKVAYGD